MPAVAAAAMVMRSLDVEPPPALRDFEVVPFGCGEPLHGDDRGLDLLRRVPPGRWKVLQHLRSLRVRIAVHRGAVALRHHDEQAVAIHERQLEPEELGVLLRLVEERERSAEIRRAHDDRDSDPIVLLLRFPQQSVQPIHLLLVDRLREREEDALRQQIVARRIAVRPRYRRREQRSGDRSEQHGPLTQAHPLPEG